MAVKAALALGLPLTIATALGHQAWGVNCSLGAFAVLYGPATAGRFRAKLVAFAGCGLVTAAALGALTQPWTPLYLAAVVAVAVVSAMVCVALKIGPPGSYFFTLTVGVGGNLVGQGMSPVQLVASVASGAVVAWLVSMSDVVVSPRGAEERAVAAADAAITRSEQLDAPRHEGPTAPDTSGDDEAGLRTRAAATEALHHAWTTVTDGAGRSALSGPRLGLAQQLRDLHERYIRLIATATHRATETPLAHPWADDRDEPAVDPPTGSLPVVPALPDPSTGEGTREVADDEGSDERDDKSDDGADDQRRQRGARAENRRRESIALKQLRETSLGRPSPIYLLRQALSWPHEVLLVGLRVGVAAGIAGVVATGLGEGHVYWAVAFAALVLHQGGTRLAQTYRGVQRLLGTLAGLGVFLLLLLAHPRGWWMVVTLVVLQFGVEMMVVRNYALATLLITPLALMVVHVGAGLAGEIGSTSTGAVLSDRLTDTVIAVGVALMVLWTTGRRSPLLIYRAQGRRCLVAMEAVMHDLATGTVDTAAARERRRHLYFELLEYDSVGGRALADADAPAQVSPHLEMRAAVIELGFIVLGACWHPDLKNAGGLFAEAKRGLAPVLASSVAEPRTAEAIRADVAAVHALVTSWEGGPGAPGDSGAPGENGQ